MFTSVFFAFDCTVFPVAGFIVVPFTGGHFFVAKVTGDRGFPCLWVHGVAISDAPLAYRARLQGCADDDDTDQEDLNQDWPLGVVPLDLGHLTVVTRRFVKDMMTKRFACCAICSRSNK